MKLIVDNLMVKAKNKRILNNISFSLETGEILAIKGANGSGKSTLCKAIACVSSNYGLDVSGIIKVCGKELSVLSIAERCSYISYICQNPDSYQFLSRVEDELSFAPENLCLSRNEIRMRVDEALEICSITDLRQSTLSELSGGEKQLVAIASVLTMKSNFIIADEITSRIDQQRSEQIRKLLTHLKDSGIGILMISHNSQDIKIANRIYTLEGGNLT